MECSKNIMNIITGQNGGVDNFLILENGQEITYLEKRRSYLLAEINQEIYNKLNENIDYLRYGTNEIVRSGGLLVKVFKPDEKLEFDHELLTIEEYEFPKQTICYSTFFTSDVIENHSTSNNYRVMAIDMIWCRADTLLERILQIIN